MRSSRAMYSITVEGVSRRLPPFMPKGPSVDDEPTKISVEFSAATDELWALAQLLKRITWADIRGCAMDEVKSA